MHDMFLVSMLLVNSSQSPLQKISDSDKNLATFLTTRIIDVWNLPSVYVAFKGMSDLDNGPNKPTATIIGECSASQFDGALISTWFRPRIFQDVTKIWPNFSQHIIDV